MNTPDVGDVALLRAIVAWRKSVGADFDFRYACYRLPDGRFLAWEQHDDISFPGYLIGVGLGTTEGRARRIMWQPCKTLTQAVDVAVAFGYLPAKFSSAYRAGWDVATGLSNAREMRRWVSPTEYADAVPVGAITW